LVHYQLKQSENKVSKVVILGHNKLGLPEKGRGLYNIKK
jgi:hypothetical protein